MKVLFITRKYPPQVGGMENFSYNLAQNLKCELKILALGKSSINLLWFFPYALFYSIINMNKYDVIHLGDMVLCSIGWAIKLINPNKIVTINIHGLDITYSLKLYQCYLRIFGHKLDKYICNSENTKKIADEIGFFNTIAIPLGVDINKFNGMIPNKTQLKNEYNIPLNNVVGITTGRLVRRKGVLWFVENVMPYLKNENFTYLIIGSGNDYELIKNAIERLGLVEKVRMLGRVSDIQLKKFYVNADIFIMPNIVTKNDVEGFGLVALEAALSGNIVVASGIEGILDAIKNMKNGLLAKSGDKDNYISIIDDVINNFDYYNRLSESFAEYTKKNYSWEHVGDIYINLFRKLCSSKNI